MRLLLSAALVSFVMFPFLAQAQQPVSDTQVAAMVEALRKAAPQKGTPTSGYYSEWQVKPDTLRGWSKFCLKRELTPAQFENTATARQVISCIMRRELTNQFRATNNNETAAVRGVACWWMTGNYTGCNSGFTGDYVRKVLGFYQQPRSQAIPTTPKPTTTPSSPTLIDLLRKL